MNNNLELTFFKQNGTLEQRTPQAECLHFFWGDNRSPGIMVLGQAVYCQL